MRVMAMTSIRIMTLLSKKEQKASAERYKNRTSRKRQVHSCKTDNKKRLNQ